MIKDNIQKEINEALKKGDRVRVDVLRFVLSQIKYREINTKKEITDDETVGVLRSEIKKRHEAIGMFKKGNRGDLVKQNENEIAVIREFLPQDLPDEELDRIIDGILAENQGLNHPGKIIGLVMKKTKGQADGSKISSLVLQKLKKQ